MVQVEMTEGDGDPSCAYVGQDDDGQWVVRDAGGLYGGVFVNESAALRFAAEEGAAHSPHRDKVLRLRRLSLAAAMPRRN